MNFRPSPHRQRGGILVNLIVSVSFAILCVAVYLARYPLMRWAAEAWIVEDPLQPAAVIIVLGDDNFYADRATRAAELFRQGNAPLVVASGRRLRPNAGICELMEHDLIERAVPKDRIIRFPQDADSTKEQAEALARFVADHHWNSIIVVTSNYHTRRTRYIFRRVFPQDVVVRVAGALDADFDPERWYTKRESIRKLSGELAGMLVAVWELRSHVSASVKSQSVVGLGELIPLFLV
jgi:uncharacterized SAM-binding protein YcdF (DUF218 family)